MRAPLDQSILDAYSQQASWVGQSIACLAETSSTMDDCWKLVNDDRSDGQVVLAEFQTKGRGQHGRIWLAQPSSSIHLSVLVKLADELRNPAILTAWCAVSCVEAITQHCQLPVTIQWPNDLMIDCYKVGGILIETRGEHVVMGMGINVHQSRDELPLHTVKPATSLAVELADRYSHVPKTSLDRSQLVVSLLSRLDHWGTHLRDRKAIPYLDSAWQKHVEFKPGKQVSLETRHQHYVEGVVEAASLVTGIALRSQNRQVHFPVSEVSHVRLIHEPIHDRA